MQTHVAIAVTLHPGAAAGERAAKQARTGSAHAPQMFSDAYSVLSQDRHELLTCGISTLQHAC
ncbi:MAG: hypothetical protein VXW43_17730, partial [Pseudomonadota bacterium]|nr:hypothetical protein [Pseudomonadota bacterium]